MNQATQIGSVSQFTKVAGQNPLIWKQIIGRFVTHREYGKGRVTDLATSKIYVFFADKTDRQRMYFRRAEFVESFIAIEPAFDLEEIKELKEQYEESIRKRDEEKRRLEEQIRGEKHRQFLESINVLYKGAKHAPKSHRITICYKCKSNLDNTIELTCANCGWIICECGACGCGYNRN